MSLKTQEQAIQSKINTNVTALKKALKDCKVEQNDIDACQNKLIYLCQAANFIVSDITDDTVPMPTITTYERGSLYRNAVSNYNRIQYANNWLRYALKRRGVSVGNTNKMSTLITMLNNITLGDSSIVKIISFEPPTNSNGEIKFKVVNLMDRPIVNTTFKTSSLSAAYESSNGNIINSAVEYGKEWSFTTNNLGVVTLTRDDLEELFVPSSTVAFMLSKLASSDGNYSFASGYDFVEDYSITGRASDFTLSVSGDKSIISKDEVCKITCILKNYDYLMLDEKLSYTIKHGSTTVKSGNVVTNEEGKAEISYTGTGVGDLTVTVKYGTLLQETFVVEDTIAYSDCTNNSIENIISVPSNVKNSTYEFSTTGWKYGNVSSYTTMPLQSSITLSKPLMISFKLIENSNNGLTLQIGKANNTLKLLYSDNGGLYYGDNRLKSVSTNVEYRIKVHTDKIEIYENDTLLYSDDSSITEFGVTLDTGTNRYVRIKDFKIKAL